MMSVPSKVDNADETKAAGGTRAVAAAKSVDEDAVCAISVEKGDRADVDATKKTAASMGTMEAKGVKDVPPNKSANVAPNATEKIPIDEKETAIDEKETPMDEKETPIEADEAPKRKLKMIPIFVASHSGKPSHVAVPRKRAPAPMPNLAERPLVLATHLVPSLPIGLFEVLAEALEIATGRSVVLLHESRCDRPVAKNVTDIAVLPASDDWADGTLLPLSFVFDHRLNKEKSPSVYADVVVATDRAAYIEDILDLRGHRCAVPDRRKQLGATGLLFSHLHGKGEGPSFFGNILDADSQVAALQMVAGKQAEVGVMESPVIQCHKDSLPGAESLYILTSLGPLPPYRIMVNRKLSGNLAEKITACLLHVDKDHEWLERFEPYGVTGFAENRADLYDVDEMKSIITSAPYY